MIMNPIKLILILNRKRNRQWAFIKGANNTNKLARLFVLINIYLVLSFYASLNLALMVLVLPGTR